MERNKKNELMKQKILDAAYREFNEKGYELASTNVICQSAGISKGIIYHYFKSKDELYLYCVKECFSAITAYLKTHVPSFKEDPHSYIRHYFKQRRVFLTEHPEFHNLFYHNLISPPVRLIEEVEELRSAFDMLNSSIFAQIFQKHQLKEGISVEDALLHIRMYQNGIYTAFANRIGLFEEDVYEQTCLQSIKILTHGLLR